MSGRFPALVTVSEPCKPLNTVGVHVAMSVKNCNDGASSSCVENGLQSTLLIDVLVCGKIGPRTEGCDFRRWDGGEAYTTVPVAILILVNFLIPHLAKSCRHIVFIVGVIIVGMFYGGVWSFWCWIGLIRRLLPPITSSMTSFLAVVAVSTELAFLCFLSKLNSRLYHRIAMLYPIGTHTAFVFCSEFNFRSSSTHHTSLPSLFSFTKICFSNYCLAVCSPFSIKTKCDQSRRGIPDITYGNFRKLKKNREADEMNKIAASTSSTWNACISFLECSHNSKETSNFQKYGQEDARSTMPSSALLSFFLLDIRNSCFTENHGFDFFGKCPGFHLSSPIMRFKTAKYDFRIQHDFLSGSVSLNIAFVGKSMKYSCPKWRRLKNQPLITYFQLTHSKM